MGTSISSLRYGRAGTTLAVNSASPALRTSLFRQRARWSKARRRVRQCPLLLIGSEHSIARSPVRQVGVVTKPNKDPSHGAARPWPGLAQKQSSVSYRFRELSHWVDAIYAA